MKPILKISATLLLALVAGAFSQAHAQLLIDPLTVEYSDSNPNQPVINLINNSGLSSDLSTPGNAIALSSSFPTDDTGYTNNFRASANLQTLTFDLNTNPNTVNVYGDPNNPTVVTGTQTGNAGGYTVTGLYIYNYNEDGTSVESINPVTMAHDPNIGRGLASTDLQYSTDGGLTYTDYGTITLSEATGTDTYTGFQLNLSSPLANVTNLEFIGGAPFTSADGEYLVGLGEVRVLGNTGSVPEPSTCVMLGAGVLVLLVGLRRKTNA